MCARSSEPCSLSDNIWSRIRRASWATMHEGSSSPQCNLRLKDWLMRAGIGARGPSERRLNLCNMFESLVYITLYGDIKLRGPTFLLKRKGKGEEVLTKSHLLSNKLEMRVHRLPTAMSEPKCRTCIHQVAKNRTLNAI